MLSSQLGNETGKERRGGREVQEGRENKTNSEEIEENKKNRRRERKMKAVSLVLPPFQKIWGISNKGPTSLSKFEAFLLVLTAKNLAPWSTRIYWVLLPAWPLSRHPEDSQGVQMHRLQALSGNIDEACCLMWPSTASGWSPQVLTKVVSSVQCALKRARVQPDKLNPKSRLWCQSPNIRTLAMIFFLI